MRRAQTAGGISARPLTHSYSPALAVAPPPSRLTLRARARVFTRLTLANGRRTKQARGAKHRTHSSATRLYPPPSRYRGGAAVAPNPAHTRMSARTVALSRREQSSKAHEEHKQVTAHRTHTSRHAHRHYSTAKPTAYVQLLVGGCGDGVTHRALRERAFICPTVWQWATTGSCHHLPSRRQQFNQQFRQLSIPGMHAAMDCDLISAIRGAATVLSFC